MTRLARPSVRFAVLLALVVPSLVEADVLPDFEEPDCDPGYVVTYTHSGPSCVRPSCRTDADCPAGLGLVCPPGYCFRYEEDRECLDNDPYGRRDRDLAARNAFEPPPRCPPREVRAGPATCLTATDCGEGLNCSPRSCRPGPNAMSTMSTMSGSEMSGSEMSGSEMSGSEMSESNADGADGAGCAAGGAPSIVGLWLLLALRHKRRN